MSFECVRCGATGFAVLTRAPKEFVVVGTCSTCLQAFHLTDGTQSYGEWAMKALSVERNKAESPGTPWHPEWTIFFESPETQAFFGEAMAQITKMGDKIPACIDGNPPWASVSFYAGVKPVTFGAIVAAIVMQNRHVLFARLLRGAEEVRLHNRKYDIP